MDMAGSDMHRMPSLESTHTNGTDDSPFASGLTTPTDERAINIGIKRHDFPDTQYIDCPVTPKPNYTAVCDASTPPPDSKLSLRKAVTKAKSMVKLVITSPRKLKKRRPAGPQRDIADNVRVDAGPSNNTVEVETTTDVSQTAVVAQKNLDRTREVTDLLATPVQGFPLMHPPSPLPDVEITALRILDALCNASEAVTINVCLRFVVLAILLPLYSVVVGACIVLAPTHIDTVAFGHGYYFAHPPQGTARFSHWAYCAWPHVFSFLACVTYLLRWRIYIGVSIAALVVAGSFVAWSDFKVDKSIPLGTDDRQSIFLAVTEGVIDDGYCIEANGVVHTIRDGVDMSMKDFM